MDIETIKATYKNMSITELTKLIGEISALEQKAIPVLQQELITRGEHEKALSITHHLISIKYHINSWVLLDYILELKKKGFTETQIDTDLNEKHGIDKNYSQLIKASFAFKRTRECHYWMVHDYYSLSLRNNFTFIGCVYWYIPFITNWNRDLEIKHRRIAAKNQ